jgi:hypothetical protein
MFHPILNELNMGQNLDYSSAFSLIVIRKQIGRMISYHNYTIKNYNNQFLYKILRAFL